MARQKPAAVPAPEAPATPAKSKGSKYVTVACKVPTGLTLQLFEKKTIIEPTQAGPRAVDRWDRIGEQVIVRGPSSPIGQMPRGYVAPTVVGGYALTPNVDREFFETWMEQNHLNPVVMNRMIFAHAERASTISEAKELHATRSGFEPLDVENKDPRIPKPATSGIGAIATADEMANRSRLSSTAEEISSADI